MFCLVDHLGGDEGAVSGMLPGCTREKGTRWWGVLDGNTILMIALLWPCSAPSQKSSSRRGLGGLRFPFFRAASWTLGTFISTTLV